MLENKAVITPYRRDENLRETEISQPGSQVLRRPGSPRNPIQFVEKVSHSRACNLNRFQLTTEVYMASDKERNVVDIL